MEQNIENQNTENSKSAEEIEAIKAEKKAAIKARFSYFSQIFVSGFVLIFCFILFPFFLIYSSLNLFFETNKENLKQQKLVEMTNTLEYLDKYSNNKKYFHHLLSKISECAQNSEDALEFLKTNIENLKSQYPNQLQFVVWDKNGNIVSEITDREGYNYVLKKIYESLKEVTKLVKNDSTFRVSTVESVKKNLNIFRKYLGKIFIPENLKYPLNNGVNSGPFITEMGNDYSYIWYAINEKISFLCFFSDELLNDFSGLNKIVESINNSSDIISGFSIIPNINNSASKFPEKFKTDLSLALTTFENAGDSIFENDKALIKMSMPQPQIRTFCYLSKINDVWNFEQKRNLFLWIIISILLSIYCFIGFWFILKKHFFSIRWKLTVLFLFANLAPILVLGFIAKGYLESKKLSLENEVISNLEKTIHEFDNRYISLLDNYTVSLNSFLDKISERVGNGSFSKDDLNKIESLHEKYHCLDLYIIASSSKIILSKKNENISTFRKEFISSMGQGVLNYANNKAQNKDDVFLSMYDPGVSDYIRIYLKNFYNVVEFFIANMTWVYYNYPFGDKKSYNNNYLLMILWEKERFKNIFVKENFKDIFKNFPEADFYIKSNLGNYSYGSDILKQKVNSILEKNTGMTEKISGNTNIEWKRNIFVGLNGTNLKDWILFGFFPEEKINQEINILIVQIVAGALLSLLLTMIIGHLLSLQFLKPIKNLGTAAIAIGERDFSYRVPIGDKDEFGHLNQVFNRVIEGLEDFQVARIIQESLFPGNNFDVGNFKIFGRSVVMTVLGGDYYDCFKINDDYQGIIIGDVAGHGIPAGLMMAMAKSAVLTASEEVKLDPTQLTTRLHKMFFAIKNERLKRMMTFQYFVLNVKTGHFRYTNAGHCFPVIVDSNKKTAEFKDYIATPLGIGPRCRCKNQDLELEEGQSLILYTDGIVEAYNAEGEQYGYPRFQQCLPEHYDPDPETFYWNLYNKVYMQWSPKPDDDLTLILINRN